jgi:hypothetical protein
VTAANPHRGEVSITLDGASYVLRPSFEAIVEIEERLGLSIVAIVRKTAETSDIRMTEIGAIVAAGIRAHGREADDPLMAAVTNDRIGRLCWQEGLMSVLPVVQQFLLMAVNGGQASGNGEGGEPAAA